MSCRKVRRLLSVRREWTRGEQALAEAHLADCAACQAVAREYEMMDRRLRRLPRPELAVASPAIVRARMLREQRGGIEAWPWRTRASQGLALLTVLALLVAVGAALGARRDSSEQEPSGVQVAAAPPRTRTIRYTAQVNDSLQSIAQQFGLQAETILWANPELEQASDLLDLGQELIIPPVDGVWYTVQPGDTLESLAETYRTSVERIVSFESNGFREPYTLTPGRQIMLPGGTKQERFSHRYPWLDAIVLPEGAPQGSGHFSWPTDGVVTQTYWPGHLAVDIANRTGTLVRAADAGYVILSGRDTWGYGNQLVIDHGNGYVTRYAHLNALLVKAGESVEKGQQIGTMGSTGRATGPHLHFELIQNGVGIEPLQLLP